MNLLTDVKGEKTGVKEMRKFIAWYTKGLKDSAKMRDEVNHLLAKTEVENKLKEYFNNI